MSDATCSFLGNRMKIWCTELALGSCLVNRGRDPQGRRRTHPSYLALGQVPISVTLKLDQIHALCGSPQHSSSPNNRLPKSWAVFSILPWSRVSIILTLARILNKAKVRAQWIMKAYLISIWWLKNDKLLLESFPLFLCFLQVLGKSCCIILPFVQTKKYNRTMNAIPCVMRFPMLTGGVVASNLFRWSLPQAWVFQSMHVPIRI